MYTLVGNTAIISKDVISLDKKFVQELAIKGVKNIKFEDGSKLKTVEKSAFETIWIIESVDFSNCQELEQIEEYAFKDCVGLKLVDFTNCTNLKQIGKGAFDSCSNLIDAKMENCTNLTELCHNAFRSCHNLKFFNFEGCPNLENITRATFENCYKLKSVDLSKNNKLVSIGEYAFGHCLSLQDVKFPKESSVFKVVGPFAFVVCSELGDIDLSSTSIETVGSNAFSYCDKAMNINLSNCKNLTTCYNIKNSEKKIDKPLIDNLDLRGCTKLASLDSINAKNVHMSFLKEYNNSIRRLFKYIITAKDANVIIYDRNGREAIKFVNNSKGFSLFNPYSIGLSHYAHRKGLDNQYVPLFNALTSPKELEVALQNYDKVVALINDRNKALKTRHAGLGCAVLLRELGAFGLNCEAKELEAYKNLLAKDLINHKIVKDIRAVNNKDFVDRLIQQKMNRIAKTYSLTDLVLEFVKNNVVGHENENNLYDFCASTFKLKSDLKPEFAQFFVNNFNDVMLKTAYKVDENREFQQLVDGYLPINIIHNDFEKLLKKSNKKTISRSNNQRFTIEDCKSVNSYENIQAGNELLAEYCMSAHIGQKGFDYLQEVFNEGKARVDKQILKVCEDDTQFDFTYKFIEKDNPIGLVLGNITNCCQRYGQRGQSCMVDGATNVHSGFLTLNYKGNIIGQAWVWYNPKTMTIGVDNIEVPDVYYDLVNKKYKTEVVECIDRACDNMFATMNKKGTPVYSLYIGVANTDIAQLKNKYHTSTKQVVCPYADYSDLNKQGYYVVYKNSRKQYVAEDVLTENQKDNVQTY